MKPEERGPCMLREVVKAQIILQVLRRFTHVHHGNSVGGYERESS